MSKIIGGRTIEFENVYIHSFAAVGGKKEGEGPLSKYFDKIFYDEYLKEKSFEKAESMLQKSALEIALKKGNLNPENIGALFAGDLLNQCIGSSFGLRDFGIPFVGLYGACSTMALSIGVASTFIDAKALKTAASITSSHFCSSERQFRFPLEYGSVRTPTAQWTATASGAVILTDAKTHLRVAKYTPGKLVDLGVKDANNMGAAMAPAAADTILKFFEDTHISPENYDKIFTGDLGIVGTRLLHEILMGEGLNIEKRHADCGKLLFDPQTADVHAGASGCGCVGSTLAGMILRKMTDGEYKRVLVCGTGALLSTVSTSQGETIPCVAHLIEIEKA